jgi:hypothetical protein
MLNIDSIPKYPSQTNPKEQVASVTPMQSWFARSDRPTGMTISIGTGAPEPSPAPPDGSGPIIEYNGQLKVVSDTYFKTSPKMSSELGSADKVLVKRGTIFNINYFSDVGSSHWLIDLAEPTIGDGTRTSWYVYTPDIRLMTDAILTVTYDTFFKLENKPSSQLPADKKGLCPTGDSI